MPFCPSLTPQIIRTMIFESKPMARSSTGLPDLQPPPNPPQPATDTSPRSSPSRAHLWLRRLGVLFFVFLCATIGVMLMILPWRPEWTDNHLIAPYPWLREVFDNGFTRG